MKLFVFGSTGDLVRRKVMRALQSLSIEDLEVYAIGRREMDRNSYQDFICSDWCTVDFKNRIRYLQADFSNLNVKDFENYFEQGKINYFYLSLPPGLVKNVISFLSEVKEKGYPVKILSEKPFGESLNSSEELKNFIFDNRLENEFLISDHYLFKKSFLKLPVDFSKVKVVSVEEVGLEGRVGYYDSVGAMRDMIQSHFLNLVMKNMHFDFSLDDFSILEMSMGQYKGYIEELGENSETETYVRIKFFSSGKEFEFITGKSFNEKKSFIEVDGKVFEDELENSYIEVFKKFLSDDFSGFPTVADSILSWKIIEKFDKFFDGHKVKRYSSGISLNDVF